MLISIKKEKFSELINEVKILSDYLQNMVIEKSINHINFEVIINDVCMNADIHMKRLNRYLIDEEYNEELKIDEYMCIIKTEDIQCIRSIIKIMKNILKDFKVEV